MILVLLKPPKALFIEIFASLSLKSFSRGQHVNVHYVCILHRQFKNSVLRIRAELFLFINCNFSEKRNQISLSSEVT